MIVVAAAILLISTSMFGLMIALFLARVGKRDRVLSDGDRATRVTLLKPLAGDEDDLAGNLATFGEISWPDYEIIFGAASETDAAVPVARAFIASHPNVKAKLVLTDRGAATNPKVAQLLGMLPHAAGEVIVISDANTRVNPEYLTCLMETLLTPGVALATNVIAGLGEQTPGAALENLMLGGHASPGVLSAYTLTKRAISIGKSMAMRRADLERVGGFEIVAHVLAEDHVLGQKFDRAGMKVVVCPTPIGNPNLTCGASRSFERHTRWAKMRRVIAPHGFIFEPFLSPVLVSLVVMVVHPTLTTLGIWGFATLLQYIGTMMCLRALRGAALPLRYAHVELARPYIMFAIWLIACVSKRVNWRGHAFDLGENTLLVPRRAS